MLETIPSFSDAGRRPNPGTKILVLYIKEGMSLPEVHCDLCYRNASILALASAEVAALRQDLGFFHESQLFVPLFHPVEHLTRPRFYMERLLSDELRGPVEDMKLKMGNADLHMVHRPEVCGLGTVEERSFAGLTMDFSEAC